MSDLLLRLARANIGRAAPPPVGHRDHERTTMWWPSQHTPAVTLGGMLHGLQIPERESVVDALATIAGARHGSPVFIDTETTGLGWDAGTLAFIVGLGWFEDDHLRTEQWLLRAREDEATMLDAVASILADQVEAGAVLVSFNGSSFDLPMLRERMRRYKVDATALDAPHVDLLHVARRLWRGELPDCRLTTLERWRLGVCREGDLGGSDIAAAFATFALDPDDPIEVELVDRVRLHNAADVAVLPALAHRIGAWLDAPPDAGAAVRAARHLAAVGDLDAAAARLQPWIAGSMHAVEAIDRDVAMLLADLHRRQGRHRIAAQLWAYVCEAFPGDPEAHEALAKHLEHRVGDLAGALRIATRSVQPCARRVARLSRRLLG